MPGGFHLRESRGFGSDDRIRFYPKWRECKREMRRCETARGCVLDSIAICDYCWVLQANGR